ncbi:tudor domain-containing 6-like [Anabrus simplex]|uniref:tudor domain-containing 6-like n=1 Tax=Anabrus simplex TaxID=316456 RepID=UPI0035A29470
MTPATWVECCDNSFSALAAISGSSRRLMLGVQVFDLDGMRLEMFKTVIGNPMLMVEPVSPMPVRNYTVDVWVSHVDGPQRLWLQSTASEEQLVKLLDLLHNFYESDGSGHTLDSPEAGHFCAAKSSKDDGWYRAKVQSVHEDSVSVLFIDYGNSEIVPFQNLRELDPSFFTPHMLSLCASLYVVAKDEDECRNYLTELVSEKVFSATFVKDSSGAWLVDLLDGDKSVAQQLIQSGLALTKGSALSLPDTYSTVQLPVGKQCSVYFSYFESPSEFYVQPAYLHDDITNFQKDLNDIAASLQNLEKLSTVGILCAAQFSVDFQWYRALIMDSNIPVVRVRFVDYGNIDEIDITCTPLKILPTELKTQPFFAVRCSLNAASLANNKQVSLVEDLALNQEVVVEIEVHDSGDPVTVSLIPSENVESYLEVATVAPVQQQEMYKEIGEDFRENINDCSLSESVLAVVKEDTENKSLIWHVTTPAEFWIQDNSVSPSLDEMAERLAEAASFPALESIDEGLLCAALFPEDELWYRALILKVINDCACVRYIDYGNSSLSTQLRALPMDLVSLPPLAKCCQLMLPDTIYPRSLEQAETVELRIGANGDPMIVKIKTEEEEAVLLASEDVAELKGSNEVTICHVTSPTSFWVHFTKDMPLLEEIAEKLLLCESCDALPDPAIGSVCAALFPEDEQWYRAEILSCSENGIEVFFIDYGNSSLSTDLRCLPTEVLNIPRVAKHCYLMLPEAWTTWPLAAEEHFLNISGNDSKSFQITILREGNPAGVSLSYDGIRVEDEILKDCQLVVSSDHMKSDLPLEVNVNFATERSSTSTETEKLGVIDVCFQKGEKVVISHINSLTDFWIQKIALQGQLDEMAEKLTSAESFSVHFPRLAGLLCAARYDEDLNWYRARIVHCSEQGAEVLFIDYGNKSLCCELRSLPLELAAIPPLAKHCNLVVPENWTEWPQSLEEEFLDIFQDSSKIFELTVLFEGDPSLVSLVHGEVNIENELKKRYEEKNQSCNDDKVVLEGEKSVCDSQESERIFAGTEITSEECDEESVGQQIILEDQVNKEATQEVDGGNLESIDVVDEEITMVETEQEILVIEEVTDATESVAEEGTYSSGEESSATKECHNEISTETENLTEAQTAVPDSPGKPHTTNSDFEEEKSEIDDLVSGKDREENEVMPGTEENQMGSVGIDEEITLVETEQELLVIEELNTVTEESSSPQEIVEECEEINDGDDTSQDASVKENQEDSVGVDEEITLVEGEQVLLVIEELNTVTEESSTAQEIVEECEEINDGDDTGQDASVKENQEDSVGIDEEITLVEGEQELLVIEELNTVTEESSTAQEIVEECEEINDGDDTGQDASVKENQEDSVGVDEEITLVETEQELLVIEELNTVTEESSTAQEIVEECEEINDGDDTGQDASVKENQEDSVGVDEEITLVETEQELLVIEELNTVTEESSTAQEIVEECEEINDGDDTGQDASVKENQEDSVGVDEEITLVEDEQVLLVIEELSSVTENSSAAQGIIEGEPEENYNRDDTIPEKMSTEEVSCASDEETSENLYLRVTDKVGGEQEVIIMGEETQNREDSVDEENIEVDNDERGAEDEIIIEEVSDDVESMLLDTEDKRNGDGFPVNGEETTSFTPRQHRPPESVKNTVSEITTLLKDTEKDIIHITHGKMFPPEEKMLKENSGTSEEKIIGDKSFTNGDAKNHVQTLTEEEITYCAPKLDMPLRSGEVKENGVVCCTSFGLPTRLQQPLQSRRVVKITHALSPKDFWVRYKNKSLLLDDIDLKLTNAQGFDPLLIAVEGTLCVARCSDNEPFQRGKVVGCHELNTDVFFLDSGKTAVCTKLFCLPEGIETTPPLAKHCCLTLPENWNVWPPAADTEFVNIIEDDSQDFELIVLKDGDPAEVSLLLNGVKVESELEKRLTSR